MQICTVKTSFSAAKRLLGFKGKCAQLHGYRHVVEASFSGGEGDMVADFYVLQDKLQSWLDNNWDHNVVLNVDDNELGEAVSKITGQKVFYLEQNPTAEIMAEYLKNYVCNDFMDGIKCVGIRLYDTDNAWVEV